MTKLSHTNNEGKARMVDVSDKIIQRRTAVATGFISLSEMAVNLVKENNMKKGDVLTVAEIAGIQGAKRTHDLIPLCHPLALNKVEVICQLKENGVAVKATTRCDGKTGVEMEALTAVSTALLTVYDMCKAVDKTMVISDITLVNKTKE